MALKGPISRGAFLLLALLAALALAGCGSSGDKQTTKVTTGSSTNPKSAYPVRLTYVADSPYGKPVTDAQLDEGVATLDKRAQALGLKDTQIKKKKGGIVITYAPDDYGRSASSQLPVQGRLFFYNFNDNVIGSPDKPIENIYDAVKGASKRKPVSSPDNTTGDQYYLFGNLRNYRGGPAGSRKVLLTRYKGKQPPQTEILTVPPGTIVVLANPLSNSLDPGDFNGDFVMRDRPQLDNGDIANVRFVAGDKPGVRFDFTKAGQAKFKTLTKQVAAEGEAGDPASVAAVLDTAILSKVPIPPDKYPDGLDPSAGAVVSGDLTEQQAKDLAVVLDSGPLPFRLTPVLQEQVQSG